MAGGGKGTKSYPVYDCCLNIIYTIDNINYINDLKTVDYKTYNKGGTVKIRYGKKDKNNTILDEIYTNNLNFMKQFYSIMLIVIFVMTVFMGTWKH
jgi:hypothetical protein